MPGVDTNIPALMYVFPHHQAIFQFSEDSDWVSYKFNSILMISTYR